MKMIDGLPEEGRRPFVRMGVWRASLAAVLLAGLFSLFFFVLRPDQTEDGLAGRVLPARLVATAGGAASDSFTDRLPSALPWLIPAGVALLVAVWIARTPRRRAWAGVGLIVAAGLFVNGGRLLQGDEAGTVGVRPGRVAQNFEASDLDGLRFALSDLRGQPVVINFWATWCTSCLAEMPVLEQQRQAHEAEGLTIVAVNVQEGVGKAREFMEALALFDFVVAMDIDVTISDAYGVRGLPLSVFIDRDGMIQARFQGELDEETMDRYVQAAIEAVPGGEPPDRLQFLNVVPREHVLEVYADGDEPGRARFVSRRFRCDEEYCGAPAAALLKDVAGVTDTDLRSYGAPPALLVTFDPAAITLEELTAILADALRAYPDRLYTRELQVRFVTEAQ